MSDESTDRDPFLWLEEVEGVDTLAWVRERNRATHAAIAERPGFGALRARPRAAFDADLEVGVSGCGTGISRRENR